MHLLHSVRPDKQYLWVQENLQPLYHDWLSSSFLYAANAFGIGYFSFNSPLSANSIPGISFPALTRYPLICHSTWLKMCFASGSFSSTDAPPPRRSSILPGCGRRGKSNAAEGAGCDPAGACESCTESWKRTALYERVAAFYRKFIPQQI